MERMPDPQPLSNALSELIALRGVARIRGATHLASCWSDIAGPKVAGATKVLGIRNGVLHIGVSNAPLMGELASFHKSSLLQAFRRQHADLGIRDIKFRLKWSKQQ